MKRLALLLVLLLLNSGCTVTQTSKAYLYPLTSNVRLLVEPAHEPVKPFPRTAWAKALETACRDPRVRSRLSELLSGAKVVLEHASRHSTKEGLWSAPPPDADVVIRVRELPEEVVIEPASGVDPYVHLRRRIEFAVVWRDAELRIDPKAAAQALEGTGKTTVIAQWSQAIVPEFSAFQLAFDEFVVRHFSPAWRIVFTTNIYSGFTSQAKIWDFFEDSRKVFKARYRWEFDPPAS